MYSLIKKSLLTGVGLAVMTKDKVRELGEELVKKGELSEKEGKELIDDLLEEAKKARKEFETRVERLVRDAMERVNVATKEDVAELAARIEQLEGKGVGEGE